MSSGGRRRERRARGRLWLAAAVLITGGCELVLGIEDPELVGSDDSPDRDAGVPDEELPDAGASACNPVTQVGCRAGEKCTWVTGGSLGETRCAPNGDVPPGEPCELDMELGYDDCRASSEAGYACSGGVCREICSRSSSASCPGGHCIQVSEVFEDLESIGLCAPSCQTHLQDCAGETQACYAFVTEDTVDGICAGISADAAELGQGAVCQKDEAGECFLNGCAGGHGPDLLADGAMAIDRCAYYCEPQETYFDSDTGTIAFEDKDGNGEPNPEGNFTTENADALPAACTTVTGASGHHCRFLASAYDFPAGVDPALIPKTMGFCAPIESSWGDCTTFSPKEIAQAAADAEESGDDPDAAVDDFCTQNPSKCAFGCVKLETLDQIFGATKVPAAAVLPPEVRKDLFGGGPGEDFELSVPSAPGGAP